MPEGVAPAVQAAIDELEEAFPGRVVSEPTGDGGADVTVAEAELGDGWTQPLAPLVFNVAYNYPHTAVYPYFLPGGVLPRGERPPALQDVVWKGRQMVQVSLRHTNWDPAVDGVVGCVVQVQAWAQQQ